MFIYIDGQLINGLIILRIVEESAENSLNA